MIHQHPSTSLAINATTNSTRRNLKPRSKHRVHFNTHIQVQAFHSINACNRRSLFFTKRDRSNRKERDSRIIEDARAGIFRECEDETLFGIRSLEVDHDIDPYEAIDAVLGEQDRQWRKGISNPDLLAYVYMQAQKS